MRFLVGEGEAAVEVDAPGGLEGMVGPEAHVVIAGVAGELQTGVDQAPAKVVAAAVGMDKQDPEPGDGWVLSVGDQEDAADTAAVQLSDPRGLPVGIVGGGIVGDDPCDQRLELGVPAELGVVDLAVGLDDPSEVSGTPQRSYLNGWLDDLHVTPPKTETTVSVRYATGMPSETAPAASARRDEVLQLAYRYALDHGMGGLSLRPLASAVGSSPRVLLFLFGSKHGLIRALLARARADELALLDHLRSSHDASDLRQTGAVVWRWLVAPEHRPLLRLWAEGYAQSLIEPDGPWARFAQETVEDWLAVLASCQPPETRDTSDAISERTLLLAVLRGALLDLLATNDAERATAAVDRYLAGMVLPRAA
jgi:AcrR family transcriptional regulator